MPISKEVVAVNIEDEMRSSYLDYAMSVIVGRALPDVRDGLKPVHRRILYAMYREGILSSHRHSKCAGVVGEVLKKYHPHGDSAVYDSLVRMAQEWNMRYPLIDGQGNFGCFTGDTRVRLADGSSKSFLELIEDEEKGKTHFTYTIKDGGQMAMAPIRAPRLTKRDAPLVCVTLDNGEKIRCTPDHRFMLRDGSYCEARHLKEGESLMPFYSRLYTGKDPNLQNYEEVYDPANAQWVFAHHLADACNLSSGCYSKKAGRVRHHRDFNKWNNDPGNILRMGWGEHRLVHQQHLKEMWAEPVFRNKMRKVLTDLWKDPAFRKKTIQAIGVENRSRASQSHQGRLNHRVVSVEPAGHADVYDLTVDETHNFVLEAGVFVHNSVDGDSAAAYRYTECRLTPLAEEMMADIDKETVDFTPNFDDSTKEPVVLPSRVPNLLLNGSDGIAVGMATKIPPHNLREIVDALLTLIRNPDLSLDDLIKMVPGPDFPTGGFVYGVGGIRQAYETGRGIIQMRAKHHFEKIGKGDREAIVVTEIPFQVNKARLIESIADLVGEERIEGIGEIRDESDREGMRVVIELKKGFETEVILNQLFKHTTLQSSFGIIMLVITGGQPRVVSLKEGLRLFLEHRKEVVTRRTHFELREATRRAHLLEGLKIAVENIDAVVALIKKSPNPPEAKKNLMAQFTLSPEQAQAILDLRLQRLTSLERDKIIGEYTEVLKLITRLKEILAKEELVLQIIEAELSELKQKFGDARRTEIVASPIENFSVEDLIHEEEMVVTVTHMGYIKRSPVDSYRAQHRGGRGKIGVSMREEDFVEDLFVASTLSYILIFTNQGKVHWLKVHEIPEASRTAKGKAISNLISLAENERIANLLPVTSFDQGGGIIFVTRKGIIKKTELSAYSHPRVGGIIALNIEEGDELIEVRLSDGRDILISTREGQTIRFKDTDVRPMGRTATGVWGIRMAGEDVVVGMTLVSEGATLLTVAENGYGKRTETGEYRLQGRGGSGVITMKTTEKTGFVLDTVQVIDADDLMLVTNMGKIIRLHVNQISVMGRNTQGVRLIQMEPGEKVVSVTKLAEKEDEEEKKSEPSPAPIA